MTVVVGGVVEGLGVGEGVIKVYGGGVGGGLRWKGGLVGFKWGCKFSVVIYNVWFNAGVIRFTAVVMMLI